MACSTSPDLGDPSEGGTDDAGLDSAPPGPPCSRLTTLCKSGDKCEGPPDCASMLCRGGNCRTPSPLDGLKDGDKTDIDCGGASAPACADGKGCIIAEDCTSSVCKGGICQVPTHTDGVKNGDETGVDCGGATAPKCPPGQGCLSDNDCNKVRCDLAAKKCKPPSHDDGIKNGDETGIDCGGPTAPNRCPPGQGCAADGDCANVRCNATTLLCEPPTSSDGLKNGTETDIDCGGGPPTNAPRCLIGKGCAAGSDCSSAGCSMNTGKCTTRSCATGETAGIVTCGSKETGQAGAVHESCCKSLVLPTRTTLRLDKYEVTSGRFRTFLSKVGPNVRAWVTTYIAANPTSQLATLVGLAPTVFPDGSNLSTIYPNADRFVPHSLTAHMVVDIDNYGGIRGCDNDYNPLVAGEGNYSSNTYWMDATHEADYGIKPRTLPRTTSDEKPLNCAMPMMFAAFCAWDGGEMATLADYHDVWVRPPTTYPWGAVDTKRPTYNWCNGPYNNGGFTCQCDGVHNIGTLGCPAAGGFSVNGQAGLFYEWPLNTDRSRDNSPLLAAPGRFPGDATLLTSGGESWMDIYANLAEYTGDFRASGSDFCDFSTAPLAGDPTCTRNGHPGQLGTKYTGIPVSGIIGQTFEGHEYNYGSVNGFEVTFQYGKFGARCVRPADPY